MRLTDTEILGVNLKYDDKGSFWGRLETSRAFGEANFSDSLIVATYSCLRGLQNHAFEVTSAAHSDDGKRTHFEVRSLS